MLDASLIWKPRSRFGGLYMGGFPHTPQDVSVRGFKLLVLCAREKLASLGDPDEESTARAYGCVTLHAPFDDDEVTPEVVKQVTRAVVAVVPAVQRCAKVLVTCNEGRNRSGLVAALSLLQMRPRMSATQVINLIKDRRVAPNGREALTNDAFRRLIETWSR